MIKLVWLSECSKLGATSWSSGILRRVTGHIYLFMLQSLHIRIQVKAGLSLALMAFNQQVLLLQTCLKQAVHSTLNLVANYCPFYHGSGLSWYSSCLSKCFCMLSVSWQAGTNATLTRIQIQKQLLQNCKFHWPFPPNNAGLFSIVLATWRGFWRSLILWTGTDRNGTDRNLIARKYVKNKCHYVPRSRRAPPSILTLWCLLPPYTYTVGPSSSAFS